MTPLELQPTDLELAAFDPPPEIQSYRIAPELDEKRRRHAGRSIGIKALDNLIGGVSSGELIVLTAKTGIGKTTLAQTITWNLAKRKIASLWYSLEVSMENFIQPFIKNDPAATWDPTGKLLQVGDYPIYWPKDYAKLDYDTLRDVIRYAHLKYGVDHVFIDHLSYLLDQKAVERSRSVSLHIGDRLRTLRQLAHETGVSVFLVAHLTKVARDVEPTLDDLRDSSFVAQEADAIILLTRDKLKEPRVEVMPDGSTVTITDSQIVKCKVEKSRRTGKRGMVELAWSKGLFYEPTFDELERLRTENLPRGQLKGL